MTQKCFVVHVSSQLFLGRNTDWTWESSAEIEPRLNKVSKFSQSHQILTLIKIHKFWWSLLVPPGTFTGITSILCLVQHHDHALKTAPKLFTFHPIVRLRMLEDNWKWPQQTVHLPHKESQKNPVKSPAKVLAETISNQNLLARCNQDSMGTIIMRRQWRWIGHVLRREPDNISHTALHWTPEGKWKRARVTQEHLESNCRRGAQDPPSHLAGDPSKADPEQTGVILYMPASIMDISEWVRELPVTCTKKKKTPVKTYLTVIRNFDSKNLQLRQFNLLVRF